MQTANTTTQQLAENAVQRWKAQQLRRELDTHITALESHINNAGPIRDNREATLQLANAVLYIVRCKRALGLI